MADKKCLVTAISIYFKLWSFIVIAVIVICILVGAIVGSSVQTLESYQVGLHYDTTAIKIDKSKLYT